MRQPDHERKRWTRGSHAVTWLAILSLTGLFSILVTPLEASAATAVVDQSQLNAPDDSGLQVGGSSNGGAAQTFQAGITGTLTQVSVAMMYDHLGNNGSPVTVEIHDTSPTGTLLATGTILATQITQQVLYGVDWIDVPLTPTPLVVSGHSYAIVLKSTTTSTYIWSAPITNAYPNGTSWHCAPVTSCTWTANSEDTAFKTWVASSNYSISFTSSISPINIGGHESVVATVTDPGGNPVGGARVHFEVISGSANSPAGFDATTVNGVGRATYTYIGTHVGTDTILACVDLNQTRTCDSGDPSTAVEITWLDISFNLNPSFQTVPTGANPSVTATVLDQNDDPVNNVLVRYSVTGSNTGSSSESTITNGNATLTYHATHAGTDTITAFLDLNRNNIPDAGEPSDTATVDVSASSLSLAPSVQTVAVNTTATLTASLSTTNVAVNGVTIRYSVTGRNSTSGTATTDSNGKASISYTGTNAGTDTISAYADMNNNGTQDSGEPTASATITWGGSSSGGGITPPPSSFAPAQPTAQKSGCMYFAATQHNLCAGFEAYWQQFGGENIFGMPVTEEFQENGVTVQYFERARFEWHPGAWPARYDVLLGLLGDEVTAGRTDAPFQATTASSSSDCTYFAQTGHNLCGTFKQYWEQFGGLANYGFPISEAFQEKNPDTGQVYTVQYFERARFELQPGAWPAHLNVLLGRLGSQVLAMKYGAELY